MKNPMKALYTMGTMILLCCISVHGHAQSQAPIPTPTLPPTPISTPIPVTISISPENQDINPGHVTTCTELDTQPTPDPTPDEGNGDDGSDPYPYPVRSNVHPTPVIHGSHLVDRPPVLGSVRFPSFVLDSTSSGKIHLSYAIVRISLPDQDYEFTLDDTEMANLLGIGSDLIIDGPTHIVSNDPHDINRQANSPFAPCGLSVNNIPITTPGIGFVVPIEVRMLASPVDPAGDEFEFSANGTVEYIP